MRIKKYYFVYIFSLILLGFVWIGPRIFNPTPIYVGEEREIIFFHEEIMVKSIGKEIDKEVDKEKEKKNYWVLIDNTNKIITFIVGAFNVYYLRLHLKKKK